MRLWRQFRWRRAQRQQGHVLFLAYPAEPTLAEPDLEQWAGELHGMIADAADSVPAPREDGS